jgi:hypothetical protein
MQKVCAMYWRRNGKNISPHQEVISDLVRSCSNSTNVSERLRYAVIVRPHDFTFATDHVFRCYSRPSSKEKEKGNVYKMA